MNIKIYKNDVLTYDDVVLVPQYSDIKSRRKEVDCSSKISETLTLEVPVFSANMDTISGKEMCVGMFEAGGMGVMHRFMSVQENVADYLYVQQKNCECFVSVGVSRDSKERFTCLYDVGARYFCIDIAHGNHVLMKEMVEWIRSVYPDVCIMAGNVGTASAVTNLEHWGVDIIKVGIAGGAVCITKKVTGVETPMITAIAECSSAAVKSLIIADGGLRTSGDIAKAIGAGADFVMAGSMFAGCAETPPVIEAGDSAVSHDMVPYRGNASKETMQKFRTAEEMPTPEGIQIMVPRQGTVKSKVSYIRDGLKSSMSYSNSRTLEEFHARALFSIKKH